MERWFGALIRQAAIGPAIVKLRCGDDQSYVEEKDAVGRLRRGVRRIPAVADRTYFGSSRWFLLHVVEDFITAMSDPLSETVLIGSFHEKRLTIVMARVLVRPICGLELEMAQLPAHLGYSHSKLKDQS